MKITELQKDLAATFRWTARLNMNEGVANHFSACVPGKSNEFNEQLAKASRVADFLELGELFAKDALERTESCGGHFREESQTPEGEALRDDKNFTFVSAWESKGNPSKAKLHKEDLKYEEIEVKTRSYK